MKRKVLFVSGLFLVACLSGVLMSKASWAGRTGMTLFYREYLFLKTWWKGAALIGITWSLLFLLQGLISRKYDRRKTVLLHSLCILIALVGFLFTYLDFTNNLSHRLLGTAFHAGVYLFWLGWIAISLYNLLNLSKTPSSFTSPGKREKVNQRT
jgi:hypothetical protein